MDGDALKALATIIRHRDLMRANLHAVASELERRAILHDESKLRPDELEGFVRINRTAREHPYGSAEYVESMTAEKGLDGCIGLHYSRNSHHPEHHPHERDMGWLDVIEMVLDWKAAADAYGHYGLRESLPKHRDRFDFSLGQWWLIEQVVGWIEEVPHAG